VQADLHVDWLGTGRMGLAMAARLIADGAAVTVWNRTASNAAGFIELGACRLDTVTTRRML
jgi:3-hydroxyisobutyrate dehydrogenase-like beta-hydroxyacid dehydrogenase